MWKYTQASNTWTTAGGSSTLNIAPTYPGSVGINFSAQPKANLIGNSCTGTCAGSRSGSASYTDANGNFYLFGGEVYKDSTSNPYFGNDLWKVSILSST